jgi:Domain of unknown function (DUF5753)
MECSGRVRAAPVRRWPRVLIEQLEHLVKLTDLPTLTIQVLPLEVGVHAGIDGTFTSLTFPSELVGDPGITYTEARVKATYYEDPAEIMTYRNTLRRIQIHACTPQETRPHRALHQAALLRPLPPPSSQPDLRLRRRDRLGGLINEYAQVA